MEVKLMYFKPSGKYYTSGSYNSCVEPYNVGTERQIANMYAICDEVEALRTSNSAPGLNYPSSYYVLVDCEDGYPCLLLPKSGD